jgi:hypothetical protein
MVCGQMMSFRIGMTSNIVKSFFYSSVYLHHVNHAFDETYNYIDSELEIIF